MERLTTDYHCRVNGCRLRHFVLNCIALCLSYSAAHAQIVENDRGHVEFKSSVPLHSFTGSSEDLVGRISLADSTIDFYVDLETLRTGLGKRDKDMRITLETDSFPFAEFFGVLLTPFDPGLETPQAARARGAFGLHGISREIEVEGTLTATPKGILLQAEWSLDLKDYGIVPPKLLFLKVDQTQKIRISTLLHPTSQ